MTYSHNLNLNGLTLHSWLSIAEVLVSLYALFVLVMSVWRRSRLNLKNTALISPATLDRSETPARLRLAARLRSRLSTFRTRTRGVVRPMAPVLLAALTLPSAMAGFAAGYYARAAQIARSTETYTWFKVVKVYDPWDFEVQFISGGNPFKMTFVHDGSESKLGWDEGMIIESLKFEKKAAGMSVASDKLGMRVHRNPDTGKFVDFREVNVSGLLRGN